MPGAAPRVDTGASAGRGPRVRRQDGRRGAADESIGVVQREDDRRIRRMVVKFSDVDDFEIEIPERHLGGDDRLDRLREAIRRGIYRVGVNPMVESVEKLTQHLQGLDAGATVTVKYADYFRWLGRWGELRYALNGRPAAATAGPSSAPPIGGKAEVDPPPAKLPPPAIAIPVVADLRSEASGASDKKRSPTVAPHEFGEPPAHNKRGGTDIAKEIAPVVSQFVAKIKYDRMVFVEQFLDHYAKLAKEKKIAPDEALMSFRANSEVAMKAGGAHCSGQAAALISMFADKGLRSYLVPSVLTAGMAVPGGPPFGHAACVIPFETLDDRGVVFADPGFNLAVPLVLRVGETVIHEAPPYTWHISLRPDGEIQATSVMGRRASVAAFDTNVSIDNPDAAIATPLAAVDTRLSIVKRNSEGVRVASVVVDLEKQQVELTAGSKRESVAFKDVPAKIEEGTLVSEALAKLLDSTVPELTTRIQKVVEGAGTLHDLRSAVRRRMDD